MTAQSTKMAGYGGWSKLILEAVVFVVLTRSTHSFHAPSFPIGGIQSMWKIPCRPFLFEVWSEKSSPPFANKRVGKQKHGQLQEVSCRGQHVCAAAYIALPDLIGTQKLQHALLRRNIEFREIPCMEFQSDGDTLQEFLVQEKWQYIIVTAPESASILLNAWISAARPDLRVVCVGEATHGILSAGGLCPWNRASSSGKDLIANLPRIQKCATRPILLPVSAKATGG